MGNAVKILFSTACQIWKAIMLLYCIQAILHKKNTAYQVYDCEWDIVFFFNNSPINKKLKLSKWHFGHKLLFLKCFGHKYCFASDILPKCCFYIDIDLEEYKLTL